jgi:transcriptional regulator with XRE-family HTH domain
MGQQLRLSGQIRFYLERLDITAAQLCRKTSIPKATISDWMGGGRPKNVDHVKAVADVFECSMEHLLYGNGLPEKTRIDGHSIDAMIGDEWIGGRFEVKIRRIR